MYAVPLEDLIRPKVSIAPPQTHMVLAGRFRYSAYQDGNVLRDRYDGRQLAVLRADGKWSRPVKASASRPKTPNELVLPLGPAVKVELTHGRYY